MDIKYLLRKFLVDLTVGNNIKICILWTSCLGICIQNMDTFQEEKSSVTTKLRERQFPLKEVNLSSLKQFYKW